MEKVKNSQQLSGQHDADISQPGNRALGTLRRLLLAVVSGLLIIPMLSGPGVARADTLSAGYVGTCLCGTSLTLQPDQYLLSANGVYKLVMQQGGNLVLYAGTKPLWDSQTQSQGAYAVLQSFSDGNFVVYSRAGAWLWSAHVPRSPSDQLQLQNDGNLVVYDTAGSAQWATMSAVEPRGATLSSNPGASGQCTWWVEQQFHAYTGAYINTLGFTGTTTGNALDWAYNASHRGWAVGSVPRIGSIAVFQAYTGGSGSVGHVAWVTEVYPAKNSIVISEMNYKGLGVTDTRTISPAFTVSGLRYIYTNP